MSRTPEKFAAERERLTRLLLEHGGRVTKRFINLDGAAYRAGALSAGFKELLGLTASAVLRCDDCIAYHLGRCREEGLSTAVIVEALEVALVVGGSIVIPHYRRALEYWERLGGSEA
ncbi:MAG: carboxymuconolactone decarboxylase family protein [Candidatus Coatesbacteria bacterium]|jgi:AhpD family alkylhydroperoxidase|nr:carboxymuconolactone decarboxylase family protein [Candidatus Coatesbacteria bacterium]